MGTIHILPSFNPSANFWISFTLWLILWDTETERFSNLSQVALLTIGWLRISFPGPSVPPLPLLPAMYKIASNWPQQIVFSLCVRIELVTSIILTVQINTAHVCQTNPNCCWRQGKREEGGLSSFQVIWIDTRFRDSALQINQGLS